MDREFINISVPVGLGELWRAQCHDEGMTLSQWVRRCCNASLSSERVQRVPEARRPGRPALGGSSSDQ